MGMNCSLWMPVVLLSYKLLFTPIFLRCMVREISAGFWVTVSFEYAYKFSVEPWHNFLLPCIIGRNSLGWMISWRIIRKSKRGSMRENPKKKRSKRIVMQRMRLMMLQKHDCQNVLTSAKRRHELFFFEFCLSYFLRRIITYFMLLLIKNLFVDKSNKWWWRNALLGHSGFWGSGSISMCLAHISYSEK